MSRYSESIKSETIDVCIRQAILEVEKTSKTNFIGMPDISIDAPKKEGEFHISIKGDVFPDPEKHKTAPSDIKLEYPVYAIEPSDEDVEQALDDIRSPYEEVQNLPEAEIKAGDVVQLSVLSNKLSGTDTTYQRINVKGFIAKMGQDNYLDGFDKALIGKKAVMQKIVMKVNKDFFDKDAVGKELELEIDINKVVRKTTTKKTDEELLSAYEAPVKTIAELQSNIKANLPYIANQYVSSMIEYELIKSVYEKWNVDVMPEYVIEKKAEQIKQATLSTKEGAFSKLTEEEIAKRSRNVAMMHTKFEMLLYCIIINKLVDIEQEDVINFCRANNVDKPMNKMSNDELNDLFNATLRAKVVSLLADNAKTKETKLTYNEFKDKYHEFRRGQGAL